MKTLKSGKVISYFVADIGKSLLNSYKDNWELVLEEKQSYAGNGVFRDEKVRTWIFRHKDRDIYLHFPFNTKDNQVNLLRTTITNSENEYLYKICEKIVELDILTKELEFVDTKINSIKDCIKRVS